MNNLHQSVIGYSALIGANLMLTQGAGGNISWKQGDTLWVKASGTWMADAKKKDIFVPVKLSSVKRNFENNSIEIEIAAATTSLKPSIEVHLHALMPHCIVLHLHPVNALAHLVRKDFKNILNKKLSKLNNWAVINYHKPGIELARAVRDALELNPLTDTLLLANHGVIIGGESIEEVDKKLNKLLDLLRVDDVPLKNAYVPKPLDLGIRPDYFPVNIVGIHSLALDIRHIQRLKENWTLYPDHVVFLGAKAHIFELKNLRGEFFVREQDAPELIFVIGVGVFCKKDFSISKRAQLECYAEVLYRQKDNEILNALTTHEVSELINWDAEHYRKLNN